MANALRDKVASGELATLMAAHNPLSALRAEEAGFYGIWASGFEFSPADRRTRCQPVASTIRPASRHDPRHH